jgi:uncharacterized protein YndB with AHSA1/START domain
MSNGRIIEEAAVLFERTLPASLEKSWAFLTQTECLREWYGEGVIEPQEGGKVTLMSGHIRGVVTGWRPQQFLGYTWNVFDPGATVSGWPVSYLEFALTPEDANTKLALTHRPILKAVGPQTMMGWHSFLDMLDDGVRGAAVEARGAYMQKNARRYGVDLDNLKR